MNLMEIVERVLAVIGLINVIVVILTIVYLALPHPEDPYAYPRRITKEKFKMVSRGRKPW